MATIPDQLTLDAQPIDTLEQRFRRLEAIWERETLYLSDAHQIIEHPAFQEIISLGGQDSAFRMEVSWTEETTAKAGRLLATVQQKPVVEMASIALVAW